MLDENGKDQNPEVQSTKPKYLQVFTDKIQLLLGKLLSSNIEGSSNDNFIQKSPNKQTFLKELGESNSQIKDFSKKLDLNEIDIVTIMRDYDKNSLEYIYMTLSYKPNLNIYPIFEISEGNNLIDSYIISDGNIVKGSNIYSEGVEFIGYGISLDDIKKSSKY